MIGLQSSLMVFPVNVLIVSIFRSTRPRERKRSLKRPKAKPDPRGPKSPLAHDHCTPPPRPAEACDLKLGAVVKVKVEPRLRVAAYFFTPRYYSMKVFHFLLSDRGGRCPISDNEEQLHIFLLNSIPQERFKGRISEWIYEGTITSLFYATSVCSP